MMEGKTLIHRIIQESNWNDPIQRLSSLVDKFPSLDLLSADNYGTI